MNNVLQPEVLLLTGDNGNIPLKQSGEIATRKEFMEFATKAFNFYDSISDKEIDEHNYNVLYKQYRSFGDSHEEAVGRLSEE